MPSPILARADALMNRKRQNEGEFDDVPVLTDAVDDDDIPLLLDAEAGPATEVAFTKECPEETGATPIAETPAEAPAAAAPQAASETETALHQAPPPTLDPGLRDLLVHELARRVEQRLSAELPRIIESTVRDFLAEQAMIASQSVQD